MIVQVTKFQTDDGALFETMFDAQQHVTLTSLEVDIYDNTSYGTTDSREIAAFIFARYRLTRMPV